MGTIRDLTRFDAQFFSTPPRQADVMDPQLRLLLETTYEAIVDAGYDPATLRGKKVGVFVGSIANEMGSALYADPDKADGYVRLGTTFCSFSNRLSYCFDFRGPSLTVITACSSSMTALNQAVLALRTGQCEAAIVGGANVLLSPTTTLMFVRLGTVSTRGKCRTFDAEADGYARSDLVGALFLQRASQARRVYARLVHIKSNEDGYKIEGPAFPSREAQVDLMQEVYAEAGVDVRDVSYIESHGTGTQSGDRQEMAAISEVFHQPGRERPIMVGSVKTNMGHSEGAAGISAVAKVIFAMETGQIAGNLHFNVPNPNIPALFDGSVEVVTKVTPFRGSLASVNACGRGGSNVHAILESNPGPHVDDLPREKPELPRLVLMAGRSKKSLTRSLDRLVSEGPYPDSAYALLNKVGQPSLKQLPYRGYALVPVDESNRKVVKDAEQTSSDKRPLWFAFTGLGCQWSAMAQQMMQFDLFARAIQRCHDVVQEFGIDLIKLVTSEEAGSQTMATTFVCIGAIQVALVEVLRAIGIQPDGIVGHSFGEIGCAYADGCLTTEQAMVFAYWRGRCVELANLPEGAMAAVGLSWEEAQKRCSDGVQPACHNAVDSVTVSGPAQAVAKLVEDLTAENVFARKVDSMGVAFHSKLISSVAPALREEYKKVLPEAKPRTKRWVSSSVPESRWNEAAVNQCSSDYFVNNFLNPVLFCEALRHVPPDAIVVEIAPHCLLQSVLGRGTGARASVVGLMKRNVDNLSFFLSSLGKLHTLGVQMDLSPLYPPVPWPVPRGTPSIGHLVAWDHSQRWGVVGWKDCITLPEGRDLFSETVIRNDVQEVDEDSTSENNPEEALLHSVARILGFEDPSSINPTISLVDLGMDSGMGVEVLHAIERFCGVVLCMQEVQRCTINALLEISGRTGTRQAA
ncbi:fatty acid synthase-like isoform X4 [Amblyomma americanum]